MATVISRKYEVIGQLGRGGMGVVYKVRHTALETVLALKVLPSSLMENQEMVARFYREARAMAQLHHANIVRVSDIDRDEELNFSYFVMEYIQGKTLSQYLHEKGSLSLAEALEIARQVASALAYAHEHTPSIIHRDIKPANIMLEDGSGRVVVMDFGIAKVLGESELTTSREMIGTLKYCSPEQIRHEPLDGRADIYALGLVLYEMYTGQQFFAGLDEHAVIGKVLYEPHENEPHFTEPTPAAFVALIGKAIAKARDKRHQRMADLLRALEGCRAELGETETVRLPTPGRCSGCGVENPSGMKFCTSCGTPLKNRCPSCGVEHMPQATFCGACGIHLAGRSVSLQPQPSIARPQTPLSYTPGHLAEKILTSKGALEGERKQVTVLFADLTIDSPAHRDPEEAQKLLDPLLERMLEAVHRYEGTVNQVLGDGIMALFGAPLAHEDHAARACYAALAMQKAIRQSTEELRRVHGIEIQLRVGLNSGEVVVRAISNDLHLEYSAVGHTTFLAARLEQLAPPGGIWLTAETLRLVEGYVEVKPLGPIPIQGLSSPVDVYELSGAEATRTRLQAAVARVLTPFVGRQHEVETLRQALEQARAGHGQVVAVMGEPGVGKSRLFYEFTQTHHTQGWRILETGAISSYGKATPYLPVIDLLQAYFQVEGPDDGREMHEQVTDKLFTLDETLRPTLPALLMLLDVPVEDPQWQALDPRQRRQRTLDAVKRLLLRESQVQPLLVIIENLHWIDTETQAFLDSLIESLPTASFLLLVNYRPEYQHSWGNKTYYTQLRLDPLPPARAEELLQALLGHDASLQPLKQRLIERTEGNPFFLEESVWTLSETKALAGERGVYRLAQAASEHPSAGHGAGRAGRPD